MSIFGAIGIASTGVGLHRKWMDAVSDNIANINNVSRTNETPYREKWIIAAAANYGSGTGGAYVAGTALGRADGRMVYEPDNPLADKNGNVLYPNVDLGDQMTHLLAAQRGYQASLAVIDRAKTAYETAISIGRR